jgi:hypothetical protein
MAVRLLVFRCVWPVTVPLLRLTARLARTYERARALDPHHAPLAAVLLPLLLAVWAPCRLASLALFTACEALVAPG